MTERKQAPEATGTPQKAPAVGSQVDLVLGARERRWLGAIEFVIVGSAWLCAYLALRTLAPAEIAWWQAGALGGLAMMLVRTWCNTLEAHNDRAEPPQGAERN